MKSFRTIVLSTFLALTIVSPFILHAVTAGTLGNGILPPCSQPVSGVSVNSDGTFVNGGTQGCGWSDMVTLASKILNFIIILAVPCAAVAFAWAGFLLLTSEGSVGKVDEAKKLFTKVAIGLFWVCAAWLVIHFILLALVGNTDYSIINNPS